MSALPTCPVVLALPSNATDPAVRKFGMRLAVRMLSELESAGGYFHDLCRLSPEFRNGLPQHNVLQCYLDAIRRSGDHRLEEGFTAVLSDAISSAVEDVMPDVKVYAKDVSREGLRLAKVSADA